MSENPLILASASPRRRELLTQIGIPFTVEIADVDESQHSGETPTDYVQRVARKKAAAVLGRFPGATVLAADTTVEIAGEILAKPSDRAEAEAMLRRLAGRTHHVHTGIAVSQHHWHRHHVETTAVTMTPIPDAELETYLATGDSLDKAGAYGIQGYAGRWVERIEGDFFNVVGLPLAATVRLLRELRLG